MRPSGVSAGVGSRRRQEQDGPAPAILMGRRSQKSCSRVKCNQRSDGPAGLQRHRLPFCPETWAWMSFPLLGCVGLGAASSRRASLCVSLGIIIVSSVSVLCRINYPLKACLTLILRLLPPAFHLLIQLLLPLHRLLTLFLQPER